MSEGIVKEEMSNNNNTIVGLLIIILVAIGVWAFRSGRLHLQCDFQRDREDGEAFKYRPKTYYEHGGWIDHPPQVPTSSTMPFGAYPSTDEPPPSGLASPGDLCQQCIGHCQMKIWAGVEPAPKNKTEKEHCIDECQLECTVFD